MLLLLLLLLLLLAADRKHRHLWVEQRCVWNQKPINHKPVSVCGCDTTPFSWVLMCTYPSWVGIPSCVHSCLDIPTCNLDQFPTCSHLQIPSSDPAPKPSFDPCTPGTVIQASNNTILSPYFTSARALHGSVQSWNWQMLHEWTHEQFNIWANGPWCMQAGK